MVIPRFVQQALLGHPITVYGDGTQSRCFTYVEDVIGAITKLMQKEECLGEIFNIGSTNEIQIIELANKVKKMTNSSSKIKKIPYDEAYEEGFEDMKRRVPDIGKLKKYIDYKPKVKLDQILNKVIDYHKGNKF